MITIGNSGSYIAGLEALSFSLVKLCKLDITGHCYINDISIFHLFKNCKLLEKVSMLHSFPISKAGLVSALGEKPTKLRYLSLPKFMIPELDSLVNLKSLTYIYLAFSSISDELLTCIAGLPLRTIAIRCCKGYSYAGLVRLLSKCQSIQHLNLHEISFLNDNHVVEQEIMRDHTTKRSCGFGFVVFDNYKVVDTLLTNWNMIDMDGTQFEAKKAETKKSSSLVSFPPFGSDSRLRYYHDGSGGPGIGGGCESGTGAGFGGTGVLYSSGFMIKLCSKIFMQTTEDGTGPCCTCKKGRS